MNLTDMDIKTITSLLFLGNLAQLVIMVFYRNISEHSHPYRHFVAGKLLQALAWALLSLREAIPALLSAYIGDALLFTGFALEVFALTTVGKEKKNWGTVYGVIACVGIFLFNVFATTPQLWVAYASLTVMSLFLTASAAMLFHACSSPMRKILGLFYGLEGLILAFRAWNGFFAGDEFLLMSRNLIQTMTFSMTFLLLIVSGIGFLLLFKEQADRQVRESELKYRTLVEHANETICILQDGKIIFSNGKGSEFLGLEPDELNGRPFSDFVFPEDLETVTAYYWGRIKNEDIPNAYEVRMTDREGKPVWVMVSVTLIEYEGKTATLVLLTNIDKLKSLEKEREMMIEDLQKALADVKTLSGLLPICASCKKIRDDQGQWETLEKYIGNRSNAEFTHGICPECSHKLYPELYEDEA